MTSVIVRAALASALLLGCSANPRPVLIPAGTPRPTPLESGKAASLISPETARQYLGVIAHDSMEGRNTPSRGLELTAAWMADNYGQWGLKPAGDSGYYQRYTMARTRFNPTDSWIQIEVDGKGQRFPLGRWGYVLGDATPAPLGGPGIFLAGPYTAEDVKDLDVNGRIVVLLVDSTRLAPTRETVTALRGKTPLAIIQMRSYGADQFQNIVQSQVGVVSSTVTGMPHIGGPDIPSIVIHDSLLADASAVERPDWELLRASPTPMILPTPPGMKLSVFVQRDTIDRVTAPNLIAMVEGSDSVLKHEYVVISAHMDHVGRVGDGVGGCSPLTRPDGSVDDICNGADDDGSGTVGLHLIARAAASLPVKPKRSLIFLNVSGEEKGLWGSAYYAEHPTVDLGQVVANINLDMIGRNAPDSIVVIGKEHSNLGATLARVQEAHPELGLTAADDIWPEQSFYSRSDHFNFARKGIPVLFFFNGVHPQYHRPNDEIELINFSKLTRVARLGLYFAMGIANNVARPVWNPESYDIIVTQQRVPRPGSGGNP